MYGCIMYGCIMYGCIMDDFVKSSNLDFLISS